MGTTGLETAFAALYTELVLSGELELATLSRADDRRRARCTGCRRRGSRRASRPTSAWSTSRRSCEVGADGYESRSENCCFHGRDAARPGAADGRRRAGRVPATRDRSRRGAARRPMSADERPPTSCSRTAPASTGSPCGADGHAVGEIVFTTSMSGYQEAMTDPSYAGQLITFTYPQIGNYGVCAEAMESDRDPRPRGDHARRRRPRGRARRRGAAGSTG